MRTGTMIAATTHIDAHYERHDREGLERMAEQLRHTYVPVTVEHDPRFPPVGRVVGARVEQLDDGEWALVQEVEYFEAHDTPDSARGDGRTFPLTVSINEKIDVVVDRGVMAHAEGLAELREVAGKKNVVFAKKAVDPLPILVITAGLFALNGIAQGFFGRLGEDLYEKMMSALETRYRDVSGEMLDLRFGIEAPHPAEVAVLIESPSHDEIRPLFLEDLKTVDELVAYSMRREADLARIVIRRIEGKMRLAYALRRDGFPVLVDWSIVPVEEIEALDG